MEVSITYDDTQWRLVPKEADSVMLDRAVAFALNVSLARGYGWTQYMRDLWDRLLSSAPTPPAQPTNTQAWYGLEGSVVRFGGDLEKLKSFYPDVKEWEAFTPSILGSEPVTQPAERKPRLVASDGMPCPNTHDPQCLWPDCMCREKSAQGIKGES